MQNKKPRNAEGQRHGLWEIYFSNGQLQWKGFFINGKQHGKHESYYYDGRLHFIMKFINNEVYGYYEHQLFGKQYYAR